MSRSVLLLAMCVLHAAIGLCADDEDPIADKLSTAKSQYREATEKARDELIGLLKKAANTARQAGDLKTLEKIEAETKAFEETGKLPMAVATKGYMNAMQQNRARMSNAYSAAVREFTKADKRELAKSTQMELDEFGKNEKAVSRGPKFGDELLQNPGCEEAAIDGKIPGWTVLSGAWWPEKVTDADGKFVFQPGAHPVSELYQDVDITSFARIVDSGKCATQITLQLRGWNGDKGRVVVECRDANMKVLNAKDTGELATPDKWQKVTFAHPLVKETRWVRVKLIARRASRGLCNVHLEDISLRLISK